MFNIINFKLTHNIMNSILGQMSLLKTILILLIINFLATYIPPLRMITYSLYFTGYLSYIVNSAIYNNTFDPNQLPVIGCLFIMIDNIILYFNQHCKKNDL